MKNTCCCSSGALLETTRADRLHLRTSADHDPWSPTAAEGAEALPAISSHPSHAACLHGATNPALLADPLALAFNYDREERCSAVGEWKGESGTGWVVGGEW